MLFRVTLLVGLACVANAEAEASHPGHYYGPPDIVPQAEPCPPQYRYVTQTQIQQVPVYTTLTKNVVIPTTLFQTRVETRFTTLTSTQQVTSTQSFTQTLFRTQTVTVTQPQFVTETRQVTQQVTETQVRTQIQTSFTPQYITRTAIQTQVAVRTEFLPHHVIQTVKQAHYVTVCPQQPASNPYW